MYAHATPAETDVPDYGRRGSPLGAGSGHGPGTDLTGKHAFRRNQRARRRAGLQAPNLPHNATHPMPEFKETKDV